MTKASRQAADYTPKTGYTADGAASSTRYEIPAACRGAYMWFHNATGATMYIRFGDDEVAVDPTADSDVTSEVLTEDGTEPLVVIPDGQAASPRVDSSWTHMALLGGASGKWHFGLATGDND